VKDKKGNPKPNTKLRDNERIPLSEDVNEYYNREVKPHLPNSWMDRERDKVGYEINFTKYFYEYKPLRSLGDITKDLLELEKESEGIFKEIVNG
jgi:type I restriction enzyme M protein